MRINGKDLRYTWGERVNVDLNGKFHELTVIGAMQLPSGEVRFVYYGGGNIFVKASHNPYTKVQRLTPLKSEGKGPITP